MIKSILQELIFDILLMLVLHLPLERIGSDGCKGMMDGKFRFRKMIHGDVVGKECFHFGKEARYIWNIDFMNG